MSINIWFRVVIAATFCTALCSAANAAVIFNNFGAGDTFLNGGLLLQGPDVHNIGDVNQAAAFTVGASGAYLTGIDIGITSGGPGVSTGPISIVLAADAAGLPGAALQSSTVNITMTGQQIASAGYPANLLLAPNTTYWVIADAEGTFDGAWDYNNIGETGPTAGQSEGFAWSLHNPEQRFVFRVEGRLVPEPMSGVLMMMGIAVTSLFGRRRIIL